MANQTVTTNKTLTQVIADGLLDGQNITINNGAVVTVDAPPTVLIGQVTINEGEMLFDGAAATDPIVFVGENLEEINVNGAGVMRSTLGWWVHPTASTGAASQVWDFSAYFSPSEVTADVFSGCWVETGRRINYDNGSGVAPKVGDWLYKYNSSDELDNGVHGRIVEVSGDGVTGYVVVQFLTGTIANNDDIEIHSLQDNDGNDLQISWTAQANGADILESDVWQEFGNARQNSANGLAVLGAGIGGFGFEMTYGSNNMSFGDGTNGFIPPAGARIRVPMVHFATATLADFGAGNTSWLSGNGNKYNIETINGGDIFLAGVSVGSAWFEDNLGGQFIAEYCAANGNFGVYACLQRVAYDHCIFVSEIEGDTRSRARGVPPIVDLVSGADVRDCFGLFTNDAAESAQFGGQTSIGVNMERCIQVSTSTANEAEFIRVNDITIDDLVVIGTQFVFSTSTFADVKNIRTQRNIDGTVGNSDQIVVQVASTNVKIRGWEILNQSCPDDSKIVISDCSDIDVACFHFIDRKFDNESLGGSQGEEFSSVGGLCNNITISRVWTDRGNPNEAVLQVAGTTKNLTVQNCSGEYTGEIDPDGINILYRGLHGGSGSLGATTGLETDYPGTTGAMMGDVFESDIKGYIYCRNCPPNEDYPITVLAGNPRFTKDGDVDHVSGDQWELDMGYFARGHVSFSGVITTTRSAISAAEGVDNWTGVDIDFQYDTGNGYNGTWLDLRTPANLTSITNMVGGIKLKLRFTATATQANNQAITIHTATTLNDQSQNLYPIDQIEASISMVGIPDGLEVRVKRGTHTVLYNGSVQGGIFSYTYFFKEERPLTITIGGVADNGTAYERRDVRLIQRATDQSLIFEEIINPSYTIS